MATVWQGGVLDQSAPVLQLRQLGLVSGQLGQLLLLLLDETSRVIKQSPQFQALIRIFSSPYTSSANS